MNLTQFLLIFNSLVQIIVAIAGITLLIIIWNWVCEMRDRCIVLARIKQQFITQPATFRHDFICRYRASISTGLNNDEGLWSEITAYTARTKTCKDDFLALLLSWHTEAMVDTQRVANA